MFSACRPVGELPLLSAGQREQLLVQWNQTQRAFARDSCVHELFAQQAARTPGAVALADIHGKAPFDLAVVRGNLDLSTDWPVVAILRENVVVLIVPTPDAYAPKRGRRHGKIESRQEKFCARSTCRRSD